MKEICLLFLFTVHADPTQEGKIGIGYIFCTAILYGTFE